MPSSHFICAQKDDKQWQIIRKNSEVKQCMFFSKCYTTFKLNCLSLAAQPTWEIWTDEGKRPAITHLYFICPFYVFIKWTNQIRNQKELEEKLMSISNFTSWQKDGIKTYTRESDSGNKVLIICTDRARTPQQTNCINQSWKLW